MEVTKDMLIGQIITIDEGFIPILMNSGMHCLGWPGSQSESLEEACMVHGIPVETLVSALNEYLAAK